MTELNDQKLPLMETFYSLQGEGFHAGRPAYFIRLAGCDVGCHWCDVKESWDADKHSKVFISSIVQQVLDSGTKLVVITGGEPAMYDLSLLTKSLKEIGAEIAIETSGAYELMGTFDWICLSPKKFKMPLEANYKKAHELKMIIFNRHDLAWAEELEKKVSKTCKRYLQPEWDKRDDMLPIMLDYVKKNTGWTVSLQTHKYLNIP